MSVLIRPSKWQRRAGETKAFTKQREKTRKAAKAARSARKGKR